MKTTIAALTDVPEALRSEYEAKDGKFVLRVEGEIPEVTETNRRLAEFRDNNIALLKEKATLEGTLKSFEGLDVNEYKALKTKVEALEKKKPAGDEDVEAKIRAAVASALEPVNAQLRAEADTRQKAEQKLAQRDLEGKLRAVGVKLKVEERAMDDFLARATRVFGVDGVARDGDVVRYSKEKVTEPLSMEEWGRDLLVDAPHLFAASKGGGANPGSGGAGRRTISGADPLELGRHMEEIAKGTIQVNPSS